MRFLTKNEVANYLRVHPKTVERWLKSGWLKGYKLGKGKTASLRISAVEFIAFLKKSRIKKDD